MFAEYEIDIDGKNYTIILNQDIGQKWSEFLAVWFTEGLKNTVDILPEIETTRNSRM